MALGTTLLQGGTVLSHGKADHVEALHNTDILIQANKIVKIGKNLSAPRGANVTDCRGKIISPGFIDTHHHLWQTQLKGLHAEMSVFDYIPSGKSIRLARSTLGCEHGEYLFSPSLTNDYQDTGRVTCIALGTSSWASLEGLSSRSMRARHSS